jgi:hypothetical protein
MSVSDDGEPDMDIIASAIEEMEQTVQMLDSILVSLRELLTKAGGIHILYNGENQSLSRLLPMWKEEYEQSADNTITWGQFLIEKLRTGSSEQ